MQSLPIDKHLPKICARLAEINNLVIVAPPGTGKTTRVAPALAGAVFASALEGRPRDEQASTDRLTSTSADGTNKIILVQPRRIAARTSAMRIAQESRTKLAEFAGYHVRFDRKANSQTRIICMTPGILLRRLQSDPILADISTIILDEFHERSLEYDLLIGMLRSVQSALREDLRLIVMSATLLADDILTFLPNAELVSVEAVTFPVKVIHQPLRAIDSKDKHRNLPSRIVESTTSSIVEMAERYEGDLLAFLPGVGEITRVKTKLDLLAQRYGWIVYTLYGSQSPDEQMLALEPADQRKIVLATNVAETSITIDGVRIVVDSGYARVERFDAATGLNRLVLEPISGASADQRAGRAGRTGPGICYRVWDEITGRSRTPFLDPEILRVDLTAVVLQLLCWGETEVEKFAWLTLPRGESITQALTALELIGAQSNRQPTALGRLLVRLPLQPRLARLLLEGRRLGIPQIAATAAALLSERDVIKRANSRTNVHRPGGRPEDIADTTASRVDANTECDVLHRIGLMQNARASTALDRAAVAAVERTAKQLLRESQGSSFDDESPQDSDGGGETSPGSNEQGLSDAEKLGKCLLAAFPDRVARRRSTTGDRGVMVGNRGVQLARETTVLKAELFLCLESDARGTDALVRIASGVHRDWLGGAALSRRKERFYNPTLRAVVTRERTYWCDLQLDESPCETPLDEETAQMLADVSAQRLDQILPKDKELHQWLARVRWVESQLAADQWPRLDPATIRSQLVDWCVGLRTLDEVSKLPWRQVLEGMLPDEAVRRLDGLAPRSIQLPSGRTVDLQYEPDRPPVLAAKIQEFFGWQETPRLAGGKTPLLLHLLAPNGRCQQITDCLRSFWANTYPTVRKELRGRYPKHAWPEDPATEPPVQRRKPKA